MNHRSELDSVGVVGRVFGRKDEVCQGGRKSAGIRAIPGRRTDGWRQNGLEVLLR
jgi:hypothetical protein